MFLCNVCLYVCFCDSGHVDWVALPKLSPIGVLCHSGLRETEDHGQALWFQ